MHGQKNIKLSNTGVIKPRRMRWAGHVARMGERKGAWQPKENISLGTLRHKWEDNIKMYLQETESVTRGID